MSQPLLHVGDEAVLPAAAFPALYTILVQQGYQPVGPTIQDGRLVLDALGGVADLPQGWTTEADAGVFRLARRADAAFFGYNLGQEFWKKFLYPASLPLFRVQRQEGGLTFQPLLQEAPPFACIGVRACELAALAIQDKIFLAGPHTDPVYAARRRSLFIVAVNCTEADAACFCASLGTGPGATAGFDLALTEIISGQEHFFLVTVGSSQGAAVMSQVSHQPVSTAVQQQARELIHQAARSQSRSLSTDDLPGLLYDNYGHPQWDDVASRCLSCGNCALVCPTCFCHSIADRLDLEGLEAERWRHWDVCHTLQFSYIHGGCIRTSPKSRYRQWLTHKLAAWIDQFGSVGCVGCGRCLVWCPVAIDLTAEIPAIRENPKQE
jgi:sulfhydrogenase subunit beta (sulfur reductase)